MQLRETLKTGLARLMDCNIPSPQLAAELLLVHVLDCDRGYLHSHPETEVPRDLATRYFGLIAERSTGKPTQYITGHQEFWGLDFEVTPDVLIPRPETEHVVESLLELAHTPAGDSTSARPRAMSAVAAAALTRGRRFQTEAPLRIIDVGTGSGCIALALASELPRATIFATDISLPALAVARRNAERLRLAERVQFLQGDLLECLLAAEPAGSSLGEVQQGMKSEDADRGVSYRGAFDFIVSNPPYVGREELDSVQREVREFEPRLAWGGVAPAEEVYGRLLAQGRARLRQGGYLVVEIGYNMGDRIRSLVGAGWSGVEVRPDLAGIPRVVAARKSLRTEPR
jgi:release factor glutamine methyltransferase